MRYINCNLPRREKEVLSGNILTVYFYGKPEFVFYLSDAPPFKRGDITRNNPGLGYRPDNVDGTFLNYDYEAARKWDLENAGCELSPSY
ncbi:MAG: hypothetical protein FWG84_06600 [Bacteroidales bacterium]|nr:hypothetical protein [Bacteroidales bacterium]